MTQQDYSNTIVFNTGDTKEIARFTEEGFYYKGEFVDDAGEVHRLLKEVLGQMKTDLNPVDAMTNDFCNVCAELTDAELSNAAKEALDSYRYPTELLYFLSEDSDEYEPLMLAIRAVLAKWGANAQ